MSHEIFRHRFACATSLVFEKKTFFKKLTILFCLQNNNILTVFSKHVKKRNVVFLAVEWFQFLLFLVEKYEVSGICCSIWTTNAAYFIEPISESSCKVLLRKIKIKILQQPTWFLRAVNFFYYFYFQNVITSLWQYI